MTNLDSIFKSRDITLPTKVHLVKAMVFPVVMYGCESWTMKKAERRRIDAFELWCWHTEVCAGVHEEEGGAGALSEGAGGWGGLPHAHRLPKMVACIRPGWCDFSQEGPLGPGGMARSDGWPFKCPFQTVTLHLGREGAEDQVSHGQMAQLNLRETGRGCCFPFCCSNRESRGQGYAAEDSAQRAGPGIPETHV